MDSKNKVSVIIVGAGGRGTVYAHLIKRMLSAKTEIVGIAEPRDFERERLVTENHIPRENVFTDWKEILQRPRFADAVIISTQDKMHAEPTIALAEKGYHILLEKPLAPDLESCRKIVQSVKKNHVMLSLCHVMRYAAYTRQLKELLNNHAVGKLISIQHLEPVGHWRFAHSFVRGSWSKESESSSILMAKSIHDLDWISYLMEQPCISISSYGSLMFFRKENMPSGAAKYCMDCPLEPQCPYSAPRFYLERYKNHPIDSYLEAVTSEPSVKNIKAALRSGPYGRCVFACDNDVVDHQEVNMEFANGSTGSFTLAGCSLYGERRTTIFGTTGEIRYNGEEIQVISYLNNHIEEIPVAPDQGTLFSHHNGGDLYCVEAFIDAIRENAPEKILTGADESLESHYLVFAAEKSRKEKRTVQLSEMRIELEK